MSLSCSCKPTPGTPKTTCSSLWGCAKTDQMPQGCERTGADFSRWQRRFTSRRVQRSAVSGLRDDH
eukprot:3158616-Rhodomonas_salina.1